MLATSCYSRDELERYLLGRANDELHAAIEIHLEACPRCDETLADLDSGDDTLVRTLQVKPDRLPGDAPAWVGRLAGTPFESVEERADSAAVGNEDEAPAELGDYQLEQILGRGGMSIVFAARHKHLGRPVALKVLLPTAEQRSVSRDRFAREMRAVGGLDHPAIIRATDAGECNGTLYLVMERIQGLDLNRISKAEGPLGISDACAICIEVARGLAYAHDQGVVHRDIKPSNLMLDDRGHLKILDFGLARMQPSACDVSLQTTVGQLLGTLDYMAPEQASGADVDARADIYGLGATLFKLLAGVPPRGRSADVPIIEFLHRLATTEAPRLDAYRDGLPPELVEIVSCMVRRDPAQRLPDAADVVARLEPFAANADLTQLASAARAKSVAPEDGHADAVQASLGAWRAEPQVDPAPTVEKPPRSDALPVLRGFGAGWIALAATLGALLGGIALTIILTLRSPEGEIRIESELENVRVELVDEEDHVDLLTVDQGKAQTTVRTGRYRIRLDSPADGIEVTPREVVVSKGTVVLAKVTKVAEGAGSTQAKGKQNGAGAPQRSRVVAMEAQIQLAQTMDELAVARRQEQPDQRLIETLEAKLSRLRALSRPIPTEPVYEGRTLPDWVAQMRFEQESSARQVAAMNVLKLAGTRPADEQMQLLLEAGTRLNAWSSRTLAERLLYELRDGPQSIGSSVRQIMSVDRTHAAEHVVRALQSDDPERREFALSLCLDLREQIQDQDWPGIVPQLRKLCEELDGETRLICQVTLAMCESDRRAAGETLQAISLEAATADLVAAIMLAGIERRLDVPRPRQIHWLATYLDRLPFLAPNEFPDELVGFWYQPTMGPFRGVQWNDPGEEVGAEVNTLVGPLLKSFERRLAEADEQMDDDQRQRRVAAKSKVLMTVMEVTDLGGTTRQQALDLLQHRLRQLLEIRANRNQPPDELTDTPQGIASVIMLATGKVPDVLQQPGLDEPGFLAEQFAATFKNDAGQGNSLASDGTTRGIFGGRRFTLNLASWYPSEVFAELLQQHVRLTESERERNASRRQLPAFLRRTRSGGPWDLDVRLMLGFASRSAEAAEFTENFASQADLSRDLMRHPALANFVAELMTDADSQAACGLGFSLWAKTHSREEILARWMRWLESGDPLHARFALAHLAKQGDEQFLKDQAGLVAGAIDRIAEQHRLTEDELTYLNALGDKAPRAARHAVAYLRSWLREPELRVGDDPRNDRRAFYSRFSRLVPCVEILLRSPEAAAELREELEQVVNDESSSVGTPQDRVLLKQLVVKLAR